MPFPAVYRVTIFTNFMYALRQQWWRSAQIVVSRINLIPRDWLRCPKIPSEPTVDFIKVKI